MGSGGGNYTRTTEHTTLVMAIFMPQEIQNEIVSHRNPKVRLTINDLELAVLVLGWLVLDYVVGGMKFKHNVSFCDIKSAVAWAYRGRNSA